MKKTIKVKITDWWIVYSNTKYTNYFIILYIKASKRHEIFEDLCKYRKVDSDGRYQ
ncbi:hypothetical protein [Campylobacter sp. 2018MI27]|uniref:hypothetical protein n=1 Tax=Campylobacter sp. 2018MI27 TaxID=2836738 RepID=UPI001BD9EF75|nr:hypothetical protein [Campylobacter sp. 2018MI27]